MLTLFYTWVGKVLVVILRCIRACPQSRVLPFRRPFRDISSSIPSYQHLHHHGYRRLSHLSPRFWSSTAEQETKTRLSNLREDATVGLSRVEDVMAS